MDMGFIIMDLHLTYIMVLCHFDLFFIIMDLRLTHIYDLTTFIILYIYVMTHYDPMISIYLSYNLHFTYVMDLSIMFLVYEC